MGMFDMTDRVGAFFQECAKAQINAAKGSGYISGQACDYSVNLVREHGTCPLELGEYEEGIRAHE